MNKLSWVSSVVLVGCASDPETLRTGEYRVDAFEIDSTCPTDPVPIEGGWSCAIGSFRADAANEQAEDRASLQCGSPLAPTTTWSIESRSQQSSILGVLDTGRAFTTYAIALDGATLGGEADGDAEEVWLAGGGLDSLHLPSTWSGTMIVLGADRFTGTLDLQAMTVTNASCELHYQLEGSR